jgi:hypothetical protein
MRKLMKDKKAVSPLVATLILVGFSLLLGTITMNVGKAYIADISSAGGEIDEGASLKPIDGSFYSCSNTNPVTKKCMLWEFVR